MRKSTDKRECPVITVTGGPGCGKSRLLSELPRLSLEATSGDTVLHTLLLDAFTFHVSFENGTRYQQTEASGAVALGNRMMWQLVRPADGAGFAAFAAKHAYIAEDAFAKLEVLKGAPLAGLPVFVLVDGLDKLIPLSGSLSVFEQAVGAVSAAVGSHTVFVIGAISAILSGPIGAVFGRSQQARVYLQPPTLPSPELVVPDTLCSGADLRGLALLRSDMGGYGRALEVLHDVLAKVGAPLAWQVLADSVTHKLLETFDAWLMSPDVAPVRESLLEAIVSRRPFSSVADLVAGTWTVDTVCSLGLVQWGGGAGDPRPLAAPFILLLMLRQKLRADGPLYQLALGYDKLETGSRAGNRWQDLEFFVAAFRAVKASAFRGRGWVPLADLHYGARLSAAAQALHVRTPSGSLVVVASAIHQYKSKSSMGVKAVRTVDRRMSITSGNVVVLNGANAKAADVFLNSEATVNPGAYAPRLLREAYACRHRVTPVDQADFDKEWHKAADVADLFIFFTQQEVKVDLGAGVSQRDFRLGLDLDAQIIFDILPHAVQVRGAASVGGFPGYRSSLVGFVDCSCFKDYFGFSGRVFS